MTEIHEQPVAPDIDSLSIGDRYRALGLAKKALLEGGIDMQDRNYVEVLYHESDNPHILAARDNIAAILAGRI